MKHLLDLESDSLSEQLQSWGQPQFRQRQIADWVRRAVGGIEEMGNLPKALQEKLAAEFRLWTTAILKHQSSPDGTEKLLLSLDDGGQIECVLLRDEIRRTICVSSQVGCGMGCVFCASGLDGVDRNLTAGEIKEQMLRLQQRLPEGERLSHIVMMGMGEPLANLERVLNALDWASSEQGLGISPRRITISTVGIPAAIRRLAEHQRPYNLAVSLHAPNDELRQSIVPTNEKTGIEAILEASDLYFHQSGRRLTFEYVLLRDLNDRPEHATELVALLRGRDVLINVIPYNPVAGLPYRTPTHETIRQFREILEEAGHTIKFRQRKGDQIDAACGQLRRAQTGDSSVVQLKTPE